MYPLQVDIASELVPNANRALETLFDGCAAHAGCSQRWPNLRRALYDLVRRLDEAPATVGVADSETGEVLFEGAVTGDELLGVVFQGLYSDVIITYLPVAIALAEEGDYDFLGLLLGLPLYSSERIAAGMQASVQCHEEYAFSSRAKVEAAAEPYPELADFVVGDSSFGLCGVWDSGKAGPEENEPVHSDIPALVLAGEYDPITPPAWGRMVAADLTNSFFFEFPGIGHGAFGADECPKGIALAFLDNPTVTPDAACITEMPPPDFVLP
jgi:pimeloyl-ACP methyl ester carboxylesterase